MSHEPAALSSELQQKLLRMARETIVSYVRARQAPEYEVTEPELLEKAGAFVTIKRRGQLRGGCAPERSGSMAGLISTRPLAATSIRAMAANGASMALPNIWK